MYTHMESSMHSMPCMATAPQGWDEHRHMYRYLEAYHARPAVCTPCWRAVSTGVALLARARCDCMARGLALHRLPAPG